MNTNILFEANIYMNVEEEHDDNTWFLIVMGGSFVLTILTAPHDFSLLPIGGMFIFFIGEKLYKLFTYQKLVFDEAGILKMDNSAVFFNDIEIKWRDVKEIKIEINDYYGMRIFRRRGDNRHSLSIGLNNIIILLTDQGPSYYYFIQLNSKEELNLLKKTLWDLVKSSTFSIENAKSIIHPQSYREFQDLKKYCKS
jgi:hypothetical protein